MLYAAYELQRQLSRPVRLWANALEQVYSSPYNPLTDTYRGGGVAWAVGEIPSLMLMLAIAIMWSRSDARMAKRLDFGCVWINTHIPLVAEMPHGGYKKSGYGKDLSAYALDDYTRINMLILRNPAVFNILDCCSISIPMHRPGDAPTGLIYHRVGVEHVASLRSDTKRSADLKHVVSIRNHARGSVPEGRS